MQRFKQHNQGARLPLTEDDFLIAPQTSRLAAGVLRQIRRRVARGGFAEQSVHDFGGPSSGWFWHWHGTVSPEHLAEVGTALAAALEAVAGVLTSDDPDGVFRRVEFWAGGRAAEVCMEDVAGSPTRDVPAFERAWRLVVGLFPRVSSPGEQRRAEPGVAADGGDMSAFEIRSSPGPRRG